MITLCMVHGRTSADFLPLLEPVSTNRVNHIPHAWRAGKGKSLLHRLGGVEKASLGKNIFVLEMESHCVSLCARI